jgi:Fe-S-cluster containining protein
MGHDYARLDDRVDELVWFDGNRAYMRMVDGRCAALRVEPASRRFVCSAYATRPDACRDLARGSGACRAELEAKAGRAVLALGRMPRDVGAT